MANRLSCRRTKKAIAHLENCFQFQVLLDDGQRAQVQAEPDLLKKRRLLAKFSDGALGSIEQFFIRGRRIAAIVDAGRPLPRDMSTKGSHGRR